MTIKKKLGPSFIVAFYTFKELLKSKLLSVAVVGALAVAIISLLASELTYGEPVRVALDVGLALLSLSSVAVSLFLGSSLITKELENRTVHIILTRPIGRTSFLLGKILGLVLMIGLNFLLISIMTLIVYLSMGGTLTTAIMACTFFTFLEAIWVLTLVILFSLITSSTLAVLITFCLYVCGHAVEEVLKNTIINNTPVLKFMLKSYAMVMPNFSKINLRPEVIYQQVIDSSYIFNGSVYVTAYILFLLIISNFIFANKDLD